MYNLEIEYLTTDPDLKEMIDAYWTFGAGNQPKFVKKDFLDKFGVNSGHVDPLFRDVDPPRLRSGK